MVPRPSNARYVEISRSISRLRDKLKQDKLGHQRLALWGVEGVGYDSVL